MQSRRTASAPPRLWISIAWRTWSNACAAAGPVYDTVRAWSPITSRGPGSPSAVTVDDTRFSMLARRVSGESGAHGSASSAESGTPSGILRFTPPAMMHSSTFARTRIASWGMRSSSAIAFSCGVPWLAPLERIAASDGLSARRSRRPISQPYLSAASS